MNVSFQFIAGVKDDIVATLERAETAFQKESESWSGSNSELHSHKLRFTDQSKQLEGYKELNVMIRTLSGSISLRTIFFIIDYGKTESTKGGTK